MSCTMLTEKQTGILAATIADMFNAGLAAGGKSLEVYGLDMNGADWNYFLRENGCRDGYYWCSAYKLAHVLYNTNLAAYNGRYDEHPAEAAPAEYFTAPDALRSLAQRAEYNPKTSRLKLAQWHYDFSVLLDHYLYQISEEATDRSELYNLIQELSETVKRDIVRMDERLRNAYDLLREIG